MNDEHRTGDVYQTANLYTLAEMLVALEAMVDQHGLYAVLQTLAEVCGEKAEHLRTNWQDADTAKYWSHDAKAIDKVATRIKS